MACFSSTSADAKKRNELAPGATARGERRRSLRERRRAHSLFFDSRATRPFFSFGASSLASLSRCPLSLSSFLEEPRHFFSFAALSSFARGATSLAASSIAELFLSLFLFVSRATPTFFSLLLFSSSAAAASSFAALSSSCRSDGASDVAASGASRSLFLSLSFLSLSLSGNHDLFLSCFFLLLLVSSPSSSCSAALSSSRCSSRAHSKALIIAPTPKPSSSRPLQIPHHRAHSKSLIIAPTPNPSSRSLFYPPS